MDKNLDTVGLAELYETLNVSDSAKELFFNSFVMNEANTAGDDAGKAKGLMKVLGVFDKFAPTVEQSTQKMAQAIEGIKQVINMSPVQNQNMKKADIALIEQYASKVQNATKTILDSKAQFDAVEKSFPSAQYTLQQMEADAQSAQNLSQSLDAAQDSASLEKVKAEAQKAYDNFNATNADVANENPYASVLYDIKAKEIELKSNELSTQIDSAKTPEELETLKDTINQEIDKVAKERPGNEEPLKDLLSDIDDKAKELQETNPEQQADSESADNQGNSAEGSEQVETETAQSSETDSQNATEEQHPQDDQTSENNANPEQNNTESEALKPEEQAQQNEELQQPDDKKSDDDIPIEDFIIPDDDSEKKDDKSDSDDNEKEPEQEEDKQD